MRTSRVLAIILALLIIAAPVHSVQADAAPPQNPPGGDVSPEGGTEVQMTAEQVIIDFRATTDDRAQVTAWFLFHNTGSADEFMNVRFPLVVDMLTIFDPNASNDEINSRLIQNFTASVGGVTLPTQKVKDTDPNATDYFLYGYEDMYWSTFPVTFPAGQDVKLSVSYSFMPTEAENYAQISYILATGAGWKGPIGAADVNIIFPYVLNDLNLFNYEADQGLIIPYYGRSMTVVENEIHLHWVDLEPTRDDNVMFSVLQPKIWQEILRRRIQVMNYPADAGGWEALATAYAAAGVEHHGMLSNPKLASMYISAAEQALNLDPNNAQFHFEFGKNMFDAGYLPGNEYYLAIAENELATALQLDPTNAELLQFLSDYQAYLPNPLPTPGPFPTASFPTFTPTEVFVNVSTRTSGPTSTYMPTVTPYFTRTPTLPVSTAPAAAPQPRTPWLVILGGLVLAGAGFAAGARVGRRKN